MQIHVVVKRKLTNSASGAGGQKIYVIPDLDIVIAAASRTSLIKDVSYILNDVIGKFILPSSWGTNRPHRS